MIEVGKPACELEATFLQGEGPKSLSEGRGKVVIVDFWATYCKPCKRSFPKYQSLVDKHAGEVAVMAISVDAPDDVTKGDIERFGQNHGNVKFPILWDKSQSTARMYRPPTMPTSYIVDGEGIVRHVIEGYSSKAIEETEAALAELMSL